MSEKKIRVAFIGNMSVGKSTVLNSIIGEDILPTSQKECTYRGVILKYNNSNVFKLYKTSLIKKGEGLDEYYIFKPDKKPVCEGKEQIKSYLKNKNNDKKIEDKDAYIIITGKLRIFDFINVSQKLVNRIEFIDLPGHTRENNEFNRKQYYKKILKFTNCCIYINESKSIEDEDSCERISSQYKEDKQKVLSVFRNRFIITCLFLINKCDEIKEEKDRIKIKNALLKNVLDFEKDAKVEEINISFFSGKCFNYYLEMYGKYVFDLEKSPLSILQDIFLVWYKKYFNKYKFSEYIDEYVFRNIEKKLDLDLFVEIDESEKDFELFSTKLKKDLKFFCDLNKINLEEDEKSEIIAQFYLLNKQLKTKDLENTNYSYSFFEKLKTVIINSSNLQKENFEKNLFNYFDKLDILFYQKYNKDQQKIKEKKELIQSLYTNIEISKELFDKKKNDIRTCIDNGKAKCLKIIDDNIQNVEKKLKEANNNIKDAANNMQQKIKTIIEDIKIQQMDIINSLTKSLEVLLKDKMNKIEIINSLSIKEINTESNKVSIVGSLFTSTLSGVAIRTGLAYIGEAIVSAELIAAEGAAAVGTATGTEIIGGALLGPVGIAIGIGVGIGILGYQLYKAFNKSSKYEEALNKYKVEFIKKMDESKEICLEDFQLYKTEFFNDISQKIELSKHDINEAKINEKEWQKIKIEYDIKKNNILHLMKDNILD